MRSALSLTATLLRHKTAPAGILTMLALRDALTGCERILDIGCGIASPLRLFGCAHLTGIDAYAPDIDEARRKGTHHDLICGDVRQLARYVTPGQFDACVALDLIEHLTKEDGLELLEAMGRCATKRVVILTPSGFLPQGETQPGDFQAHLSGWTPAEMRALGYVVKGVLGPKNLRGEYHALRRRPTALWALVSLAGHLLWTKRHPEQAAAMVCVKTL